MTDSDKMILAISVTFRKHYPDLLAECADTLAAAIYELVKPKPLVWECFEGRRTAKASAWRKANYLITRWSSGDFDLVESYPGYQGDNLAGCFFPNLEAAKAAAQSHADAAHWANTPLGDMMEGQFDR